MDYAGVIMSGFHDVLLLGSHCPHLPVLTCLTAVGNTSLDPTLSFLMANMARVDRCSLVLDPFVGTGMCHQ